MIFMKSFNFLQYCNNCLFYYRTVCESYDITRKVWKVYITSPLLGRMIKPVIIGDFIRMGQSISFHLCN